MFRDIFQLHHGHGGEQRGADRAGPQLPPQAPGHPQHAHLGQSYLIIFNYCFHTAILISLEHWVDIGMGTLALG